VFGRRRRRAVVSDEPDAMVSAEPQTETAGGRPFVAAERPQGPWDRQEHADQSPEPNRVDLGSVSVTLQEGVGLRVEVDKASGKANRLMLLSQDSGVQVVVVAAPRSRSYWDEVLPVIQENAQSGGGTVRREDGEFGPVLVLAMPVMGSDGKRATNEAGKAVVQPSYVVGIDGPRWMMRATFLGRAALDEEARKPLMSIVKSMVVDRGDEAKVPGEPLVLSPAAPPEGGSLVMESSGELPGSDDEGD
jgi:hypothetical protein